MRVHVLIGVLCTVTVHGAAAAATLSTTTNNNGNGGVFMNLTAGAQTVTIGSFDTYFQSSAGTSLNVEVWTRPGSYLGFDSSSVGWTLLETVATTSAGMTSLAPINLTSGITIGSGSTVGVYIHSITAGSGIRYTGTGVSPPQTTWNDANLTLFSDRARTFEVPFAGGLFTPRTFAGNINYSVAPVPEPASMAALGLLVGVTFILRRRKA
jgi:hypothetical protein